MAKISLRQLQQLIREAVNEQLEEMGPGGVEEGVDEMFIGGSAGFGARTPSYMYGKSGKAEAVPPEAVEKAEEIIAKPNFSELFAEFISLPDDNPRKNELSKMWSAPIKEAVRRNRRNLRKNR